MGAVFTEPNEPPWKMLHCNVVDSIMALSFTDAAPQTLSSMGTSLLRRKDVNMATVTLSPAANTTRSR